MRGGGWECWRPECDGKGGALELIAAVELGRVVIGSNPDDWRRVHARAYQIGATTEPPETDQPLPPPRRLPRVRVERPKPYPGATRLSLLWCYGSLPASAVPAGRAWLEREIPTWRPGASVGELARIIPTRQEMAEARGTLAARSLPRLPAWAGFQGGGSDGRAWRRDWTSSGHRILIPMFDAAGTMRSVTARHIDGSERPSGALKNTVPRGRSVSGLVFASPLACMMLRGDDWWRLCQVATPDHCYTPSAYICEGERDWLAATLSVDPLNPRAVFGVSSGAWTREHADRLIAAGIREVTIDTDADRAGDRYADAIAETLQGRAQITRYRDPGGRDLCERLALPGGR
jgi:hypothetical protein